MLFPSICEREPSHSLIQVPMVSEKGYRLCEAQHSGVNTVIHLAHIQVSRDVFIYFSSKHFT